MSPRRLSDGAGDILFCYNIFMQTKNVTLGFLLRENQVLLAMKKRGFGVGKWNGVGGKVEENETFEAAMIREAKEEISVQLSSENLSRCAVLDFYFSATNEKPAYKHHCVVYTTSEFSGDPKESEEMNPQWFNVHQLPLQSMWSDDPLWLPRVLKGEKLQAEFWFNEAFECIKHNISPLKENNI